MKEEYDPFEKFNRPVFHAISKLGDSKLSRFFYPRVIEGDIVSQMFVNTFRWSFFSVLVIGFFYYFFLQKSHYVHIIFTYADAFIGFVARKGYFYDAERVLPNTIGGIFFLLSVFYATFFFFQKIKQIPSTAYGKYSDGIFVSLSGFVLIPFFILLLLFMMC